MMTTTAMPTIPTRLPEPAEDEHEERDDREHDQHGNEAHAVRVGRCGNHGLIPSFGWTTLLCHEIRFTNHTSRSACQTISAGAEYQRSTA